MSNPIQLIHALYSETTPISGHLDPGAVKDTWDELTIIVGQQTGQIVQLQEDIKTLTDERGQLSAENAELHADAMVFDAKLTEVARIRLDLEVENKNLRAEVEQYRAALDSIAYHDGRMTGGDMQTIAFDTLNNVDAAADTQGRAERPEVHRSGGLPDAPRLADDKQEPANCEWFEDDDGWHGTCGQWWEFTYDGPVENGLNYCMKCGKPVSVDKVRSEK